MNNLKAPITILIAMFLILFHGIRIFFMQFKRQLFRRRVLAGAFCACLLTVSMPFPVLAAENSEGVQEEIQENTYDDIHGIVSATELPDEVKEQTDEGNESESEKLDKQNTIESGDVGNEDTENSDGADILAEDIKLPEIGVTEAETEIMSAEEAEALPDVSGSTTPVCGVITSDTAWRKGTLSDGTVIINSDATLTIYDRITIEGNVTIKGGGTILRGNGIACIDVEDSQSEVTFENITIDGASRSGWWSMIMSHDTIFDKCTIKNCISENWAGVVQCNGNLTIRDTIISNCSASEGGAIVHASRYGTPVLRIKDTSIIDCSAGANGGAIMIYGTRAMLENTTIKNCHANICGGAIYTRVYSDNTLGDYCEPDLTIKSGSFIDNKTIRGNYGGGCIWAEGSLNISGGEFTGNASAGSGGCIWAEGTLNISGGKFLQNTSARSGGCIGKTAGRDSVIRISGGYFAGNTCANEGYLESGAIYVSLGTHLILSSEAHFCGDDAFGTDGIMLENEKKIFISDTLSYPVTVYGLASDGRVIAEGTDGHQLSSENDIEKIKFVGTDIYGEEYDTVLDGANNQIKLSQVKEIKIVTAAFYSGTDMRKVEISVEVNNETQTAILTAPSLEELPGYTPVGWSKNTSDYTADIVQGGETEIAEDTSFYGVYKKGAVLSYDRNYRLGKEGGTSDTASESQTAAIYATVNEETINYKYPTITLASAPSRDGYVFNEWNTMQDGSGDTYKSGADFELRGDTTLYAQWISGDAEYTVEHYLQDVSGVGYTKAEVATEIISGTVEEVVYAMPKTYLGFKENTTHGSRKESGVVASDGSLVLRLYYDRDVYHITFDLNGGTGTAPEPQKLRYGALLQNVGRPEKPGYTFMGWYMGEPGTEGKAWDFDKTVEENTEKKSETLYAGWVDDIAPEITFSSKDGSLSDSFYGDVTVTVSVNDEGTPGNADTAEIAKIAGGIASVTYRLDNGAETAVEGKGFESGIVTSCDFSVEISGVGEHNLKVTATDNAGNENTSQASIRIVQEPTQKNKIPVIPASRKKTPALSLPALNPSAPVAEQFIALADLSQPLKTAGPVKDDEPRTGDDSCVDLYATIAILTGLFYLCYILRRKEME